MAPITQKKARLADIINYRVKVITVDSRQFIGELLSFDKHYNLVLSNTEEYRLTKKSLMSLKDRARNKTTTDSEQSHVQEQKRTLGLIILRGEHVISVTIEGPPASATTKLKQMKQGNGVIKPLPKGTVSGSNGSKLTGPVRTTAPGFQGAPKRFNPPPGFKK